MGVTTDELLVSQNSGGGHHSEQLSQQLGHETDIRNCSGVLLNTKPDSITATAVLV